MGKNKRQRTNLHSKQKTRSKLSTSTHSAFTPQTQAEWKSKPKARSLAQSAMQKENVEPTIPFTKYDRILLVGEGDLSFAASLVKHHGVRSLVATVFEAKRNELEEKYPHVGENIKVIENWIEKSKEGEAEEAEIIAKRCHAEIAAMAELENDEQEALLSAEAEEGLARFKRPREGKVLYGIDATKMGPYYDPIAKAAGKGKIGAYDSIQFMFPHCGGKSTDVNRQVRYNQGMFVNLSELSYSRIINSLRVTGRLFPAGLAMSSTERLNCSHTLRGPTVRAVVHQESCSARWSGS